MTTTPKQEPKDVRYNTNQKELLTQILTILNVTEDTPRMPVTLTDSQRTAITALDPQIHKYYKCSTWSYYKSKPLKDPIMSLLKSILKYHNITTELTKDSTGQYYKLDNVNM